MSPRRSDGHTGVIPRQYLLPGLPRLCQLLRAVLAHAHAVAVASDAERNALRIRRQGKAGRSQGEDAAHLRALDVRTAHGDSLYPAGIILRHRTEPRLRRAGEFYLRVGRQQKVKNKLQ